MTTVSNYDPIPETVAEALQKWDSGETVFTVEMGGLGPDYEKCIQVLAFEIMRAWSNAKISWPDGKLPDTLASRLDNIADEIVGRLDSTYGFSGAQVGAAKSLAACVCKRGYRDALRDDAVKDRLIQVSKDFPIDTPTKGTNQ